MTKCHFDDNEAKFKFTPLSDGKSFDICEECLFVFAEIRKSSIECDCCGCRFSTIPFSSFFSHSLFFCSEECAKEYYKKVRPFKCYFACSNCNSRHTNEIWCDNDGREFCSKECAIEYWKKHNRKEDKEMSIKNTILANCDITVSTANKIASQHEDDPQWDFWQTQEVSHDSERENNDSMEGQ